MAKEQNPDAYHGNGRISQAVGKATLGGMVAGVAAGAACVAAIVATGNGNLADKSDKQVIGTVVAVLGSLVLGATAGAAFGAVDGYTKADRAINDHDRLAHDAGEARTLIHQAVNQGLITPREVSLEKS